MWHVPLVGGRDVHVNHTVRMSTKTGHFIHRDLIQELTPIASKMVRGLKAVASQLPQKSMGMKSYT